MRKATKLKVVKPSKTKSTRSKIEMKPEPKQYVADTVHTELYKNSKGEEVFGTKPLAVLSFYMEEARCPDAFGHFRKSELAISLKWIVGLVQSIPGGKEALAEQNKREQELNK